MKQYILKEDIDKKLLINNGFIENGKNSLSFRKRVFEDAISLLIIIKFGQEDITSEVRLMDNYLDKEYGAIYTDYGRNEMKEKVIQKYEFIMDDLVKKGIFEEKTNPRKLTYKISLKVGKNVINEDAFNVNNSFIKNNLDKILEIYLKKEMENVELTIKANGKVIENTKFLAKLNNGKVQKITLGR